MQDRADQQRVAGFLPVIALFQWPFRVHEDVGNILHVAHLPFTAAHLEQRIVGGGFRIGRIEQQHAPVARSEEHTSELQSLMRISYAVFCLKKKNKHYIIIKSNIHAHYTHINTPLKKHDVTYKYTE